MRTTTQNKLSFLFPKKEKKKKKKKTLLKRSPKILSFFFVCIGFRVYCDTLNNEKWIFWFYPSLLEVENVSASFIRSLSLAFYSHTNKVFERRESNKKKEENKRREG